jgi:hypothetical protein
MRERGQAGVETVALTAVALALAIALGVGIVRLGPTFASSLGRALASVIAPVSPQAPALDDLERDLLAGARGPGTDGPTLLDLQTHLRSRLDRPAADAAFTAAVRLLVDQTLAATSITSPPGAIAVVDRATEDGWIRRRFHPELSRKVGETVLGLMGTPGAMYSLASDLGLATDEPMDGIEPGFEAGDIVVRVGVAGYDGVVLRRREGSGLVIVRRLRAADAAAGTSTPNGEQPVAMAPGGASP